jgi:WD40 repeat protein
VRQPSADRWAAAVHAGERDREPLGSAVVVAARQVLTCAHVVVSAGEVREPLWVWFPATAGAAGDERRRVASVVAAYAPPVTDVALLVLDRDVPAGVGAAPLRRPRPADLAGLPWRAFGFTGPGAPGDAEGVAGAPLPHGWVRLDTTSPRVARPGFSGAGLWSPDYEAVVGLVGRAPATGEERAVTLHEADLSLPDQGLARLTGWSLRDADDVALGAWGGPGGGPSEREHGFAGRSRALTRISRWLARPVADRRVLVVTGAPGSGKSAVLGRVVTASAAAGRAAAPERDSALGASPGPVACAVHARGKTALEVARQIARAASARLPDEPGDLATALRAALDDRGGQRFNVIIDGLDEAVRPSQARAIVDAIVRPLAETGADSGVQVIAGTGPGDDTGSLIAPLADDAIVIDLDDPEYFDEDDLAACALEGLRRAPGGRPGGPYDDDAAAGPVARRIAALSDRSFLIAGLAAAGHGRHDEQAAEPGQLKFDPTADAALAGYLERAAPVAGQPAGVALAGLAFAEAPGLTADLWQLAIEAIAGKRVPAADLERLARSPDGSELIQPGRDASGRKVFWLRHQALNDALARARADIRPRRDDERALTLAFVGYGRRHDWENAPEYLARSLPGHAAPAGLVDDLLTDDAYLLHADLRRLLLAAGRAVSPAGRRRARMVALTPEAIAADAGGRAALFSVSQALLGTEPGYAGRAGAPYRARWARAQQRPARGVPEGHRDWVRAIGPVTVGGRDLLASGGDDRTVRIWDPATGDQCAVLPGHADFVRAVCAVTVDGRDLLASGGDDRTVRIWDPATGDQRAVLEGHRGGVGALCPVTVAGERLLASAGTDRTVRLWDPVTGRRRRVLRGHTGSVVGVCPVTVGGEQMLASAGTDRTVRIWEPVTGEQRGVLRGHRGGVSAVCPVTADGRELLASAGGDSTVRLWDLGTGEQRAVLRGHQDWVSGVVPVTTGGRDRLVSAGRDATVRIWDPASGTCVLTIPTHHPALTAAPAGGLLAIGLVAGVLVVELNPPGR